MHVQRHRRRLIMGLCAGAGILALLITVGVYGMLRGSANDRALPASTVGTTAAAPSSPIAHPRPLTAMTNPELFAEITASALFGWDTRGTAGPSDWSQVLVDVGDPEEAAGLAADVRGYLPTIEQWEQLKAYGTRQWLTIESIRVPDAWATALAQAAPDQLPPGATAYTVSGIRHRSGTWNDEKAVTASKVAFTLFIACPSGGHCRLLRLSRVNEPLE